MCILLSLANVSVTCCKETTVIPAASSEFSWAFLSDDQDIPTKLNLALPLHSTSSKPPDQEWTHWMFYLLDWCLHLWVCISYPSIYMWGAFLKLMTIIKRKTFNVRNFMLKSSVFFFPKIKIEQNYISLSHKTKKRCFSLCRKLLMAFWGSVMICFLFSCVFLGMCCQREDTRLDGSLA